MLKDIRAKLVELLGEVVVLCEEEDLTYCASERLLWDAHTAQGFQDGNLELVLMMPAKDLKRFENRANRGMSAARELETSKENASLAPGALRYVAGDSTFINLRQLLNSRPGLGITIKPLRRGIFGTKYMMDAGSIIALSSDPFSSLAKGSFEGVELPLVAKKKSDYWAKVMGSKAAKNCTVPLVERGRGVIVDEGVPYGAYLDAVGRERVATLCEKHGEYAAWRGGEYAALEAQADASVATMTMITQRFRCAEEFLPQKEALLAAWEYDLKDEVAQALSSYTSYLKTLYRDGLTVYFDEELFDLAVKVLRYKGWRHAGELKALAPAQHREENLGAQVEQLLEA